jgi:hypothetical protein
LTKALGFIGRGRGLRQSENRLPDAEISLFKTDRLVPKWARTF